MKYVIALLFSVSLNLTLAQTPPKTIPVSVGYFGHAFIQPGVKVGTSFTIKNWETSRERKQESIIRKKQLFISPQIAYFTRPQIHNSFLLNVELGYRTQKAERKMYSAWSLGLGYLAQFQITGLKVNLGDGSQQKLRERWDYFMPTLSYEFGGKINSAIGWYSKYTLGLKMAPSRERVVMFFGELGLKFPLF